MEFHPQPTPGTARPWAFPEPERGALPNGLTVLRCHRPGQQVVAVEIFLDAPLEAEPEGLDGVATIMSRALSEGTDKHSARSSPPSWSAAAPRSTPTRTTRHPRLPGGPGLPSGQGPRSGRRGAAGPGLRRERDRAPRRQPPRRDPARAGQPVAPRRKQLSKELFPADARMSRPRLGTEETVRRIDAAAVRAFFERTSARPPRRRRGRRPHRHRPGRAARGDPRRLVGRRRTAPPGAADHADDTGRVVIVDRPARSRPSC